MAGNAELARRLHEAWNERAFDETAEATAPDGTITIVGAGTKFVGPEGARAFNTMWADGFPDGRLTVFTSQHPHGQGHETTIAQVAATEFGVPLEHVRVVHGDTNTSPFNMIGTGGSRAATMASGAALHATREVKEKVLKLAGGMLEIAPDDLEIVDAVVTAKGAPAKAMPLAQVAAAAYFANPPS